MADKNQSVIVGKERPVVQNDKVDQPRDTILHIDHELHKHGLPKHHLFCNMVGMLDRFHGDTVAARKQGECLFTRLLGELFDGSIKGQDLYPRVKTDFKWCNRQYWLAATVSNLLL